jgi:hypothetical protein
MKSSNKTIIAKKYLLKEITIRQKYIVDYFQRKNSWERLKIDNWLRI